MRRFRVVDVPQRSPEWFAERCGLLTGSSAGDMLAKVKSGEAAARRDLRLRLVCERLTGRPEPNDYINADMQRGIDCEPLALAAYEAVTGQIAVTSGFIRSTELMAGCSLDAHVGDYEGLVSLKCPKSATHLGYLRDGVFPSRYTGQMLHELWITGAAFYEFLSWDGRFPAELQTFYVRVERDDKQVEAYAKEALAFLAEVDRDVEALKTLTNLRGQLEAAIA